MTRPFFSKDRITHFDIFDRHAEDAINQFKVRLQQGYPVDFQVRCLRWSTTLSSLDSYSPGCANSLARRTWRLVSLSTLPLNSSLAPTCCPSPLGFPIHFIHLSPSHRLHPSIPPMSFPVPLPKVNGSLHSVSAMLIIGPSLNFGGTRARNIWLSSTSLLIQS